MIGLAIWLAVGACVHWAMLYYAAKENRDNWMQTSIWLFVWTLLAGPIVAAIAVCEVIQEWRIDRHNQGDRS